MADAAGTRRRSRPAASRFAYQQDERLEPVLQLVVGADRQVGLAGTDTDQRDIQLVAQKPDEVEELRAGLTHQHPGPTARRSVSAICSSSASRWRGRSGAPSAASSAV
jgi:hypothetical protein